MRKIWKDAVRTCYAVCVCLLVFIGILLWNTSRLCALDGVATFYLQDASSQAYIKSKLNFADVFSLRGESVCVQFSSDDEAQAFAKAWLTEQKVEIAFCEEVGDTFSIYGYSPRFTSCIFLCGKAVNAHLAIRNGVLVIGTPIIFGGY